MTAPVEKTLNYGLRYACAFALNPNGTPKAVDATPYEGAQFRGSTAFDLNLPTVRTITGLGEDGITQVVFLPPNTAYTAKLNVEAVDPSLAALLDNTKIATVGEISLLGLGTEQMGYEPRVALMLYQAARGLDSGQTYWHTYFMPSAQVVRQPHSQNNQQGTTVYQVAPNRVTKHLWGTAFALATEGYVSAQILEAWSNYPLRLASFVADGTATDFLFPVATPAVQTTGIMVWRNGAPVTTGLTKTVTKVTFGSAPTLADQIVVLREVAN